MRSAQQNLGQLRAADLTLLLRPGLRLLIGLVVLTSVAVIALLLWTIARMGSETSPLLPFPTLAVPVGYLILVTIAVAIIRARLSRYRGKGLFSTPSSWLTSLAVIAAIASGRLPAERTDRPESDPIDDLYLRLAEEAENHGTDTEAYQATFERLRALQSEEAKRDRQAFLASLHAPIDAGKTILEEARALRRELDGPTTGS